MKNKISDRRFKKSKCYKCIWLTKINRNRVYCPFFACIRINNRE
ncbi:hypothetical protein [Caloranaerobacter azorensis]|nr:hypothetical protein [Caloranaerobacter azorensis]